jgi:pimeloyl-ACP methyl ester carboxylesterase
MKGPVLLLLLPALIACTGSTGPSREFQRPEAVMSSEGPVRIDGLDVLGYAIYAGPDTIEYIKVGTDTTTAKPTILFLQGSLPSPLIFDMGSFKQVNLPFDAAALSAHYNVVEIAMPKTPVTAGPDHLNADYDYVPDTARPDVFSPAYVKANYLEDYVDRADHVMADLMKKPWVLKDSLILIGHSQGAKVAAVVASGDRNISSVALLGFNAFGRYDELVRRERGKLRSGKVSATAYRADLDSLYQRWKEIQASPNDVGPGHLDWSSFSINYIPYLLKVDVPIFIGYGTEDPIAENCDLIPLALIRYGKSDYTLRPYIGMDHNFFTLKDGVPDRRNGAHWTNVVKDILVWARTAGKGHPTE